MLHVTQGLIIAGYIKGFAVFKKKMKILNYSFAVIWGEGLLHFSTNFHEKKEFKMIPVWFCHLKQPAMTMSAVIIG